MGARNVADLTDDEIVDAIASYGHLGLDLEDPWEGNDYRGMCEDLGIIGDGMNDDQADCVEGKLRGRIDMLMGAERLMETDGTRLFLTPEEWGRRLAGRSADEIARALAGAS